MTANLSPYEAWMVRSNLATIAAGEATANDTVALLRANGYGRVAAGVAAACASSSDSNDEVNR